MRHPILFPSLLLAGLISALPFSSGATSIPSELYEAGEEKPGGDTSHKKRLNKNAFSHSSANLPFEKELDFKVGNGFFKKIWVSSPASTKASDGLGPLFNARSCQRCHLKDGRGHPPKANFPEDNAVSMFLRLSIPPQTEEDRRALESGRLNVIAEPNYGTQLQDFSVQGVPAEGRMHIEYSEEIITLSDGVEVSLRHPTYSVTDLQYGELHPDTMLSPRVAPQMVGLGLLELIREEDILSREDQDDQDNNGISGKAQRVWSLHQDRLALGRFGWKAGNPDVDQQNQGAFVGDIGLSTPLFPSHAGECTPSQVLCRKAPNGADPQYDNLEASQKVTDLVLFYTRNLALPIRRDARKPEVLAGKAVFNSIGCADCHRPSYVTGPSESSPHLASQKIWPYSDLLLHDMGEGLADNRPEALANGQEWRTAPLWGIGKTRIVNGHTFFLHDGRARNYLEAILWHGGEARETRDRVIALSAEDRQNLLAFLDSL
ncbi:di-heme oxidoreductase family protein [Kiloniella sp. b19]|uniref:di-heme oxidoreductase family protein n=1 Tax=Kiloniella sp. GXU_MW_B19 TaxID=3141326 RepID=UPI0031DFB00C